MKLNLQKKTALFRTARKAAAKQPGPAKIHYPTKRTQRKKGEGIVSIEVLTEQLSNRDAMEAVIVDGIKQVDAWYNRYKDTNKVKADKAICYFYFNNNKTPSAFYVAKDSTFKITPTGSKQVGLMKALPMTKIWEHVNTQSDKDNVQFVNRNKAFAAWKKANLSYLPSNSDTQTNLTTKLPAEAMMTHSQGEKLKISTNDSLMGVVDPREANFKILTDNAKANKVFGNHMFFNFSALKSVGEVIATRTNVNIKSVHNKKDSIVKFSDENEMPVAEHNVTDEIITIYAIEHIYRIPKKSLEAAKEIRFYDGAEASAYAKYVKAANELSLFQDVDHDKREILKRVFAEATIIEDYDQELSSNGAGTSFSGRSDLSDDDEMSDSVKKSDLEAQIQAGVIKLNSIKDTFTKLLENAGKELDDLKSQLKKLVPSDYPGSDILTTGYLEAKIVLAGDYIEGQNKLFAQEQSKQEAILTDLHNQLEALKPPKSPGFGYR